MRAPTCHTIPHLFSHSCSFTHSRLQYKPLPRRHRFLKALTNSFIRHPPHTLPHFFSYRPPPFRKHAHGTTGPPLSALQAAPRRPCRFGARKRHWRHRATLRGGRQHQPRSAAAWQRCQRADRGQGAHARAVPQLQAHAPAVRLARRELGDAVHRVRVAGGR
eukprot:31146-Chlamydomonas_euryale.AAC.3